MKPIRLQLNHRKNPLGIDDKTFRFTWNVEGGVTQISFRLTVYNSKNETVFDSKDVLTSSMNCIADFNTKSRERYYWNVAVRDENGFEEKSEDAWFETGIFPEDIKAIG